MRKANHNWWSNQFAHQQQTFHQQQKQTKNQNNNLDCSFSMLKIIQCLIYIIYFIGISAILEEEIHLAS